MPKLHDLCQVLIEDLASSITRLPGEKKTYALILALHAVEEDLLDYDTQQLEISRHLWIVWEEYVLKHNLPLPSSSGHKPPLVEDDPIIASLVRNALFASHRLFKLKKHII